MSDGIRQHFMEAASVLSDFLSEDKNFDVIARAGQTMVDAVLSGGKIYSCGNGGSLCDAMHFAEELTGRYRENRPAIGAVAIADASHMACVANDFGYEHVFSRFLQGMGRQGDVLLAISTSGNSKNVILAAQTAREMGIKVIGLTGKDGGKLGPLCDTEIRVPWNGYADRVQEVHIKIIHSLIDYIESGVSKAVG